MLYFTVKGVIYYTVYSIVVGLSSTKIIIIYIFFVPLSKNRIFRYDKELIISL